MKKTVLFLMMTIMLTFLIIFSGCNDKSKKLNYVISNEKVNTTMQDTFKFTIDDIKKKYTEDKITGINQFKEGYVLVESIKETIGNRFDLYNLRTGEKDTLPTPQFGVVTLEQIVNENYFIFLSSGKDNDGPIGKFPYVIRCIRIRNELNKSDNFTALIEEKYFSLDEAIHSGSKEWDEMSDVNVTFDGLQILFSPIEGNEIVKLGEHAPYWSLITENILRGGNTSHAEILSRAMELCRKETGDCVWPDIPENCWAQAVNELTGLKDVN